MKKLSKKQIYILVVVLILICAIVAGTTWGILYYRNYNEVAIPCEGFLDKPDGITVHYVEDGREKSRKLSDDEIDLVFAAFENMVQNCTHAATRRSFSPLPYDEPKYKRERFIEGGDIEFHYEKRREVSLMITAPDFDPQDRDKNYLYYSFWGDIDSLSIRHMDQRNLDFVGCLNGAYYSTGGSATFSQESADNFWSVVKSCIG